MSRIVPGRRAAAEAQTDRAAPLFTVLTPTYNRAHTLPRVYESLSRQTFDDFEWVVVDDGSEDETPALVRDWQRDAPFSIRYVRQPNGGKPAAVNLGVREARGYFTLILDSDDACVPEALERLAALWESIPEAERARFSGVTVHARTPDGRIVGTPYPRDVLDAPPTDPPLRLGVRGEKWGMHRTALLREVPYPITPGERWVPEGLAWHRLGRRYLVRHANEALRIYEPSADGITARIRELMLRNPTGVTTFYREMLTLDVPLRWRLGAALRYARFGLHAGASPLRLLADSCAPGLSGAVLPLGALLWAFDRVRAGRRRDGAGA